MNETADSARPSAELQELMERIRRIVQESPGAEHADAPETNVGAATAGQYRDGGPVVETNASLQEVLASQAELNRLNLGLVRGLFDHIQRLEESLSRLDRYLSKQHLAAGSRENDGAGTF